jgi:UDP-N-acetylmuramoyl-L-alanyl-D-glutamate--2,6-diaminopimelate ligase
LPKDAFALTNADDKNGSVMVQNTKALAKTYSIRQNADFHAKVLEESFEGMSLEINGVEVFVQFVGRFNVQNILAIFASLNLLGIDSQEALIQLSAMKPVNGRFETFRSPKGVTAIIDYAHTPDALRNVLSTINEILCGKGESWTVCGAGGNRDKGKRPLMAQEAAKQSDHLILTSDNPRNEEPQDIINDMLEGLTKEEKQKTLSIIDRKEAIRVACMMAKKGDVILVAGKGHEDYQIIKGVKYHFDDHEVIQEIFESQK